MSSSGAITQLYSLDEFSGHLQKGSCHPAVALDLSGSRHFDAAQFVDKINMLVTALIGQSIQSLERLELNFRYSSLGNDGAHALKRLFSSENCPKSVLLDLRHNDITDTQVAILVSGLEKMRHAKIQLDLGHNNLSDESASTLAHLLMMTDCPLEALALENNNLSAQGVLALAGAL